MHRRSHLKVYKVYLNNCMMMLTISLMRWYTNMPKVKQSQRPFVNVAYNTNSSVSITVTAPYQTNETIYLVLHQNGVNVTNSSNFDYLLDSAEQPQDISGFCFRNASNIHSNSVWRASLDSANLVTFSSVFELKVFNLLSNQLQIQLLVSYDTLSYVYNLVLSSQLSATTNTSILSFDQKLELQNLNLTVQLNRITVYIPSFIRLLSVEPSPVQFSVRPNNIICVQKREQIVQVPNLGFGSNDRKMVIRGVQINCADNSEEGITFEVEVTETIQAQVIELNIMPIRVNQVNETHMELDQIDFNVLTIFCNSESVEVSDRVILPISCTNITVQTLELQDVTIQLEFYEISYVKYTFKPTDLSTGVPMNDGLICQVVQEHIFLNAKELYYANELNNSNSTVNSSTNSSDNSSTNSTSNTSTNSSETNTTTNSSVNSTTNSTINATESNTTTNSSTNSTNSSTNSTTNSSTNSTTNYTTNSTTNSTSQTNGTTQNNETITNSTTNSTNSTQINSTNSTNETNGTEICTDKKKCGDGATGIGWIPVLGIAALAILL
ncbi:Cysteine-rich_membrane protein 2 [Hexamita inflata]|uniref:Cysteine-rich membrane protein 2 n=1 Tax=Hexamita inflata TaxID=28002 RepID=A0AA86VSD9_9EUKA|nr:Cysteine-rich membrane protein 2 [Hexamita inflata]